MIMMMLNDERLGRRGGECRVQSASGKVVPTVMRFERERKKKKRKGGEEGQKKSC